MKTGRDTARVRCVHASAGPQPPQPMPNKRLDGGGSAAPPASAYVLAGGLWGGRREVGVWLGGWGGAQPIVQRCSWLNSVSLGDVGRLPSGAGQQRRPAAPSSHAAAFGKCTSVAGAVCHCE